MGWSGGTSDFRARFVAQPVVAIHA
jgi:hypothetical protein